MRQIILIFALMMCVGSSNFARVVEPVKPDWVQMWTTDGHVTLHDDGDRCHMVSIIEYPNGSFDYTVMNLCGSNNPPYMVTFEYYI